MKNNKEPRKAGAYNIDEIRSTMPFEELEKALNDFNPVTGVDDWVAQWLKVLKVGVAEALRQMEARK
jgi:hypothetical protein